MCNQWELAAETAKIVADVLSTEVPPITQEQMDNLSLFVERLTFQAWLTFEREQRGLSMSELAEKAGVSRTHIWQVENGESSPTVDWLRKIAKAYDCHVNVRFVPK